MIVLYEGSDIGHRALSLAYQLAMTDHNDLVVVLPAVDDQRINELKDEVEKITSSQRTQTRFISLNTNSVEDLLDIIGYEDAHIMILDATSSMWNDEKRQLLLADVACPIVFLR